VTDRKPRAYPCFICSAYVFPNEDHSCPRCGQKTVADLEYEQPLYDSADVQPIQDHAKLRFLFPPGGPAPPGPDTPRGVPQKARKRAPCPDCGHAHAGACGNCPRCRRPSLREPPATHTDIDRAVAQLSSEPSPLGELLLRTARQRADDAYGPREDQMTRVKKPSFLRDALKWRNTKRITRHGALILGAVVLLPLLPVCYVTGWVLWVPYRASRTWLQRRGRHGDGA